MNYLAQYEDDDNDGIHHEVETEIAEETLDLGTKKTRAGSSRDRPTLGEKLGIVEEYYDFMKEKSENLAVF